MPYIYYGTHMSQQNFIVIVDPFSSGALYAAQFKQQGYLCIAVRSSPDIPERFARGFQATDFVNPQLLDIDQMLAQFDPAAIKAVVAGCETAVYAADRLAAKLGLAGNPPSSSDYRREKYAMQQALAQ